MSVNAGLQLTTFPYSVGRLSFNLKPLFYKLGQTWFTLDYSRNTEPSDIQDIKGLFTTNSNPYSLLHVRLFHRGTN